MPGKLAWKDIDDIAFELAQVYPQRDPMTVRFTELRAMVESLPEFEPEPGHVVNESILEAIQAAWIEESDVSGSGQDRGDDEDEDDDDDDDDADAPGYVPPTPFRP